MSKKRALLTGATGFVGANLARRLLRDGHDVHLLVRPDHAPWRIEEIRADVRIVPADLRDAEALAGAVRAARPDWVFHLAAYGAYAWQTDAQRIVETNVLGTMRLVEACLQAGFEAFVNAGSSSEYGFKDHAPAEGEAAEPNGAYAVAKVAATLFCRHAARRRQARISTLRLYTVFGPYEEPARLMPTLILRGLEGRWPPLVHPDVAHDFVYVEDVVEAFLLAAERPSPEPGAVFNVGTGAQTPMREVVEAARRVLGIRAEPQWGTMPDRAWDSGVWVADIRKIRDALGWRPRHAFEDGFRKMADWFRAGPGRVERYRNALARPR